MTHRDPQPIRNPPRNAFGAGFGRSEQGRVDQAACALGAECWALEPRSRQKKTRPLVSFGDAAEKGGVNLKSASDDTGAGRQASTRRTPIVQVAGLRTPRRGGAMSASFPVRAASLTIRINSDTPSRAAQAVIR